MGIANVLNWGAFYLGQTVQEMRDVVDSGRALYKHGDLVKRKVKVLSAAELVELQIDPIKDRSRLFLFRDYCFRLAYKGFNFQIELIPREDDPPLSLTRVYLSESLSRLAKGVSVVGVTILTSPIWAILFIGAALWSRPVFKELAESWREGERRASFTFNPVAKRSVSNLPPEPADSHVTRDDILRIGSTLIGYRHVSTEEHAQDNAKNGFREGCSMNLSFCEHEDELSKFVGLDIRLARGEPCDELIKNYETAITDFIRTSISMDCEEFLLTYGDLLTTLDRTRFMIVKTGWSKAADTIQCGGLGRFPKENVSSKRITLLRRISRDELPFGQESNQKRFSSKFEVGARVNYIASLYRRELLRYIREDFNPQNFKKYWVSNVRSLLEKAI